MLRAVRRPMTTREITTDALRRVLLQTQGKAPEKSMDARLYTVPGVLIQ